MPAVTKALSTHNKLRLYYETAADFAGVDVGAAWEDFKVGMEHLTRWERIAVVTDVDWIKHMVRFFRFLMPGETRSLSTRGGGASTRLDRRERGSSSRKTTVMTALTLSKQFAMIRGPNERYADTK